METTRSPVVCAQRPNDPILIPIPVNPYRQDDLLVEVVVLGLRRHHGSLAAEIADDSDTMLRHSPLQLLFTEDPEFLPFFY